MPPFIFLFFNYYFDASHVATASNATGKIIQAASQWNESMVHPVHFLSCHVPLNKSKTSQVAGRSCDPCVKRSRRCARRPLRNACDVRRSFPRLWAKAAPTYCRHFWCDLGLSAEKSTARLAKVASRCRKTRKWSRLCLTTSQTNLPDESVRSQVHHQSLREGKQVNQHKRIRTRQGAKRQTVRKNDQMLCRRSVSRAVECQPWLSACRMKHLPQKIQTLSEMKLNICATHSGKCFPGFALRCERVITRAGPS